ncbi:MAG: hypothetical protein SFU55_04325 [Methylophilus sp.]|nr:hypothetical protein [Methylophilus sp.]
MRFLKAAFAVISCAPLLADASCGSAFCNLNTDWDIQCALVKQGMRLVTC